MRNYKEIEERIEKSLADLKATYDLFATSPRYIEKTSFSNGSIKLQFRRGEAIESAMVTIDHKGYIVMRLGCWCAMTPKAREGIESRKFESAHDALVFALETVEKVNRFFDQF